MKHQCAAKVFRSILWKLLKGETIQRMSFSQAMNISAALKTWDDHGILRIIPVTLGELNRSALSPPRATDIIRQNTRSLVRSAHSTASFQSTSRLYYCSATPCFFSKLVHFYIINCIDITHTRD